MGRGLPRLPWVNVRNPYLPGKSQLTWAATGGTADGQRMLYVGWVRQWLNVPGVNAFAAGNPLSLVREIVYEASTGLLLSQPVAEYELLRNATFLADADLGWLPAAGQRTLPVPAELGGAIDLLLSFRLPDGAEAVSGFGVAVRAPPAGATGAAVVAKFSVGAAATHGGRTVELLVNGLVAVVVPLLGNESTVELRVLVDRPIVEL